MTDAIVQTIDEHDCLILGPTVLVFPPRKCPACRCMRCWFRNVNGRSVCFLCVEDEHG